MTAINYFKEHFNFAEQLVLFEQLIKESIQEGDGEENALRYELGIKVESLDKQGKVIANNGRLITGRAYRVYEDADGVAQTFPNNEGQDESIA